MRQRYVDLIVNADARSMMRQRSAMVRSIRDTMHGEGYIEVETPVLLTVHGGASARPFQTHINAYDMDLYLRIATELPLKKLIVGGAERVFEIGRLFRNEGADATHNPEFTTIEFYEAYGDYRTQAALTRKLILNAAMAVNGSTVIRGLDAHGVEHEIDLAEPWSRDLGLRRHLRAARRGDHPGDVGGAAARAGRQGRTCPTSRSGGTARSSWR